jgi:hypothetical protein
MRRLAPPLLLACCCALALVLAVLAPAPASAQWGLDPGDEDDWHIAVAGSRVQQTIDGDFAFGLDAGATPIDVDGLLDLESTEDFAGRLDLKGGGSHLRLAFQPMGFAGASDLTTTVVVDGVPFSIGDRVESALDFRTYELSYRYDFRLGRFLILSPLFGMQVIEGRAGIENLSLPGTTFEERLVAAIPLVGGRIELRPLPRLGLFAEGRGLQFGGVGDLENLRVRGVEAGVRLLVSKHLAVTGRYRLDEYEFTAANVDFDLRLSGPVFDVELRF